MAADIATPPDLKRNAMPDTQIQINAGTGFAIEPGEDESISIDDGNVILIFEGDSLFNLWESMRSYFLEVRGERAKRQPEYREINMANYDEDDVSTLNAWAIWAFGELERIKGFPPQ